MVRRYQRAPFDTRREGSWRNTAARSFFHACYIGVGSYGHSDSASVIRVEAVRRGRLGVGIVRGLCLGGGILVDVLAVGIVVGVVFLVCFFCAAIVSVEGVTNEVL